MPGQVLVSGGFSLGSRFDDLVLELGGPRVCFGPTASTHPETRLVSFYESFAGRAETSHVVFNPWPRQDLREHILAQDAICWASCPGVPARTTTVRSEGATCIYSW